MPWRALGLALSALVAFTWILHAQLQRLYGLAAPVWDLGQSQQLVWSLASGHGWSSSYEYGKNFLGIHLELVFLPIAGVELLWSNPSVLLVFSAIGLAATAPAAYLMLRAILPDQPNARWLALALAVPMPFWAATQEAARDQFHPENLALALAMFAGWAGLAQRRWLFWALVVAVLCCKEDQTYTAFVIGLLVWRFGVPAMKTQGKMVMVFAAAWLVLGSGVQQLFRGGSPSPAAMYYWWIWLEPNHNFFITAVSRPDPWVAMAGLFVSLLGLPFLAPRWLLLAVPALAVNLLSSHDPQERFQLHYILLIMFPLIVAAGVGARRLLEQRKLSAWLPAPTLLAGAAPALVIAIALGRLPPALGADQWLYSQPDAAGHLLAATAVLPPGAPLYADDGAAVWLSDRTRIGILYEKENLQPDRYIVIDRKAWTHRGDPSANRIDAAAILLASGRRLLADDGRFEVWSPAGG
ncbi:MAG: DUF2079 domain-containing protein [Candidatus Dormibacteraeota bacterium]|nr:DUF2079 domain-containing protein [Candidatus Dormibacteraeota bacterium]